MPTPPIFNHTNDKVSDEIGAGNDVDIVMILGECVVDSDAEEEVDEGAVYLELLESDG